MRRYAILALMLAGCALRARPYRFGAPMLGNAAVPPPPLGEPHREQRESEAIRVAGATAPAPLAAAAIAPKAMIELPAPHQLPASEPLPVVHEPAELRTLVGRRDKGTPIIAALAWASELGIAIDGTTGPDLVAHAELAHRLAPPTEAARPGDLLVFDRVESDDLSDLVAIAIGRDARGVTEFIYVGGHVIRRGFLDARRPAVRRDATGAVVNTFLRSGKRWPPAGTHYLAGELLSHVIRTR